LTLNIMVTEIIGKLCALHIFEGLKEGLSLFSGVSRVAVIYNIRPYLPIHIYDPQHLLRGHEPRIRELFLKSDEWRQTSMPINKMGIQDFYPEKNLDLTGLISCGGRSRSVFYQMWFTEHHPNMCSTGPTERWLEHAAWLLSNDVINENACYTGTSGYVLREYATHAVRDYIVDEINMTVGMDFQIRNYPVLDSVLGISKTMEEGDWPRGKLVFVEPQWLSQLEFLARFPEFERPLLRNFKHVRKLLQAVEDSECKLVSDGKNIIGIATHKMPDYRITADFRSGYGFLSLNGKPVCSFFDGRFHSSTRKTKLVQLEEILIDAGINDSSADQTTLFKIASELVHSAEERQYGCTLVIDLKDPLIESAGQHLETPLDLRQENLLELSKSFSMLDGALHIGADMKLHRFACILDGRAFPGENRARGARFNSALRFTAQHPNIVVVVVSSDRPVSIIQEGVELNAQCEWNLVSACVPDPPTLQEWLKESHYY